MEFSTMKHQMEIYIMIILISQSCYNFKVSGLQTCRANLDLVIIVDSSSSVSSRNFKRVTTFMGDLIKQLPVESDGIRVGVVRYSTHAEVITYLGDAMEKEKKFFLAKSVRYKPGSTYTNRALALTRKSVLSPAKGERPHIRDLIIVITDGVSTSQKLTLKEVSLLKQKPSLSIVTIGIGKLVTDEELKNIASRPDMVFKVTDFSELTKLVGDLAEFSCHEMKDIRSVNATTGSRFEAAASTSLAVEHSSVPAKAFMESSKKPQLLSSLSFLPSVLSSSLLATSPTPMFLTHDPSSIKRPLTQNPSTIRRQLTQDPSTIQRPLRQDPSTIRRPLMQDPSTIRRPLTEQSAQYPTFEEATFIYEGRELTTLKDIESSQSSFVISSAVINSLQADFVIRSVVTNTDFSIADSSQLAFVIHSTVPADSDISVIDSLQPTFVIDPTFTDSEFSVIDRSQPAIVTDSDFSVTDSSQTTFVIRSAVTADTDFSLTIFISKQEIFVCSETSELNTHSVIKSSPEGLASSSVVSAKSSFSSTLLTKQDVPSTGSGFSSTLLITQKEIYSQESKLSLHNVISISLPVLASTAITAHDDFLSAISSRLQKLYAEGAKFSAFEAINSSTSSAKGDVSSLLFTRQQELQSEESKFNIHAHSESTLLPSLASSAVTAQPDFSSAISSRQELTSEETKFSLHAAINSSRAVLVTGSAVLEERHFSSTLFITQQNIYLEDSELNLYTYTPIASSQPIFVVNSVITTEDDFISSLLDQRQEIHLEENNPSRYTAISSSLQVLVESYAIVAERDFSSSLITMPQNVHSDETGFITQEAIGGSLPMFATLSVHSTESSFSSLYRQQEMHSDQLQSEESQLFIHKVINNTLDMTSSAFIVESDLLPALFSRKELLLAESEVSSSLTVLFEGSAFIDESGFSSALFFTQQERREFNSYDFITSFHPAFVISSEIGNETDFQSTLFTRQQEIHSEESELYIQKCINSSLIVLGGSSSITESDFLSKSFTRQLHSEEIELSENKTINSSLLALTESSDVIAERHLSITLSTKQQEPYQYSEGGLNTYRIIQSWLPAFPYGNDFSSKLFTSQEINPTKGKLYPHEVVNSLFLTSFISSGAIAEGNVLSASIIRQQEIHTEHKDCGTELDLVIIVDSSSSVGRENFRRVAAFVADIINLLPVQPDGIRVGLVRYSTDAEVITYLDQSMEKDKKILVARLMPYKIGLTYTNKALFLTRKTVLKPEHGERPNIPNLVILLTDGVSTKQGLTLKEARHLKRDPLTKILSIGVGNYVTMEELTDIASHPDMVYKVTDFSDLPTIVENLPKFFCSDKEENQSTSFIIRPSFDLASTVTTSYSSMPAVSKPALSTTPATLFTSSLEPIFLDTALTPSLRSIELTQGLTTT